MAAEACEAEVPASVRPILVRPAANDVMVGMTAGRPPLWWPHTSRHAQGQAQPQETYKNRVKELVVLVRLGRADVDEPPFNVGIKGRDALESNLKLQCVRARAGPLSVGRETRRGGLLKRLQAGREVAWNGFSNRVGLSKTVTFVMLTHVMSDSRYSLPSC